ncbi:hypothetical protein JZ751_009930 [Albula glossodonta]|uniref:Uncharacterized protein n=1 Tax=Albula glossodonta TaxID=121402 RepID=A0A8T2NWM0_9TELE|nr:hypothetical protein JZ751_009930 [Albula glossodonta]
MKSVEQSTILIERGEQQAFSTERQSTVAHRPRQHDYTDFSTALRGWQELTDPTPDTLANT